MGAALGAALLRGGQSVAWLPEGRSVATTERAQAAGLRPAVGIDELVGTSDLILSVCPPHAAVGVAVLAASGAAAGRRWTYVDANAVSPATAELIGRIVEQAGGRFVDGGIIGPPPSRPGTTRLYLSGPDAVPASAGLASPLIEIHVLGERPGDASALKLCYAGWTKGSAALVVACRAAARKAGVEQALEVEWRTSQPELADRYQHALRSAARKGWRWAGEMEEIAAMFASLGLPPGFHEAAAALFRDPPAGT
jgi:3-hydroxyisobutyrate dehydrogenase-like beta-hydroxyacid dehydrogenase